MEIMQHVSGSENQGQQVGSSREQSQLLSQQEEYKQQHQVDQKHCENSQIPEHGLPFTDTAKMQTPENPHQDITSQRINNEQKPAAAESESHNKQVSFSMLLPAVRPHLDKDRDMQLTTLYSKLRRNEIHRDVFVRNMRNIVGDQMLQQTVRKVALKMQQAKTEAVQISQNIPHQIQVQSHISSEQQQDVKMPPLSASLFTDSHPLLQTHQTGQNGPTDQSKIPTAIVKVQNDFSCPTKESNVQKGENETQSASQGTHVNPGSSSMAAVNQKGDLVAKQGLNEKQNLHLPQTSYPMYGANMSNYHTHPYSGRSVGASSTSLKPQNQESQNRQLPVHPLVPPITTTLGPGTNVETPSRKPLVGQKKPLDALGMTSSSASKKQKVARASLDQSIEQLNDVTTVSGVDLREEEEQLFSSSKEENQASDATIRVILEEEERLILQKVPFQEKMAKIMSKCGIKSISKDVEHCLSLCLEERIRGMIGNLIRVSKQRVDIERSRHRTIITSDIRRQILAINRMAKEDLKKKQAVEAEKLRKINEADVGTGADGDKDEGRLKNVKGNRDVDDKMRTSAANVAARFAVGGDDMLSKWQLMAEQARQKREGMDSASGVQMGSDVPRKPSSTTERIATETRDGTRRKFGRNPVTPHTKVVRTISVKDVVSVLEREPQMSKSVLLYRLYARERDVASTAE